MEDSNERDLRHALCGMRKICKMLKTSFYAVTVVFAICWVLILLSAMAEWISGRNENFAGVVYAIAAGAFAVLIFWNLAKLFEEVVKGNPPFSELQADRLRSIAIIALAFAILDFLMSFCFVYEVKPELGFGMVANNGIAEPTLNLNVGMLAFSAIMYSLSAIFRYAALLQQLSDETV